MGGQSGSDQIIFPGIWAAIAATFAATSSFLTFLTQRRNLLESVKPELVLSDWSRSLVGAGNSQHEIIKFGKVKNVGKGIALQCFFMGRVENENKPIATVSTFSHSVISSNEEVKIDGEVTIWWKNAKSSAGIGRFIGFPIVLLSWDTKGRRHKTKYKMMIFENQTMSLSQNRIAPGMDIAFRTTQSEAVWILKIKKKLRKIPILGRALKEEPIDS